METVETKVQYTPSDDKLSGQTVNVVTQTLSELEDELNALDAKVGDGDTRATFAAGKGAEDTAKSTKANAGRSSYLNSDSLAGILILELWLWLKYLQHYIKQILFSVSKVCTTLKILQSIKD
ncbi:Dihydroxyacetone kinase (DAK1) (PDB:1UN8) [Commensalibacter communis]|uniref:hypothetical protein n=1 Tax=Commensalibacter communis TaxID=2972786 RepID=UPI0022FF9C53|nr:hypothetical protein [Commensalibacter communis]CAI3945436.1 Dihydroxyacetone kinase (DAK1) (PDB:1UN8) [Commensalibacter communis]